MVIALALSAAACGSPRALRGPDAGAVGADARAAGDGASGMVADASASGAEVSGDGTGGGAAPPRCAAGVPYDGLFLCLYAPMDVGTGTEIAVEFAGTFRGMDPAGTSGRPTLGSCGAEVQRALLVEEAAGRIWRVGFGVAGWSTAELELALSGLVGTRVTGRFRGGGSVLKHPLISGRKPAGTADVA